MFKSVTQSVCRDPISTAIIIAGVAGAGATAYSATKESASAKKAAEAQKEVGLAQIEAPIKAEQAAAETARQQLKLKQAKKSEMILSVPGMQDTNTNAPSILGVPGG